jgi:hypothetical protein
VGQQLNRLIGSYARAVVEAVAVHDCEVLTPMTL